MMLSPSPLFAEAFTPHAAPRKSSAEVAPIPRAATPRPACAPGHVGGATSPLTVLAWMTP